MDIGWVGGGLAVYWLWIGLPVSFYGEQSHPPWRLTVDTNRRLVPRLRAALASDWWSIGMESANLQPNGANLIVGWPLLWDNGR